MLFRNPQSPITNFRFRTQATWLPCVYYSYLLICWLFCRNITQLLIVGLLEESLEIREAIEILFIMSEDNQADTSCASCGIAECDIIKLKECDGCDLVRYCSGDCQQIHKSEHKEACKKRVAEIRDELLFKQPESTHMGDCPICMLPLSVDPSKFGTYICCSKVVCQGCDHFHQTRQFEERIQRTCPFCREPVPKTHEENDKRRMKRVEMNDPVAMRDLGLKKCFEGDYRSAFEYLKKVAVQGDAEAHYQLSNMYCCGHGVEKDMGKYIHHLEEAAIGGHPGARYNLGCFEWNNNSNTERAVKYWIIAAAQGYDKSIKTLMEKFREGYVSKEDLAAALRAHKAAVDATKSPQREKGEVFYRAMGLM